MKRFIVVGAVALMCAGGAAGAQDPVSPEVGAEIVAARQAAFMMSGVTVGSIKASLDSDAPAQSMGFSSNALKRWSSSMTNLFPAGTGPDAVPATRAKAEIWTDWTGFKSKADDYAAAAARLQELIAAGDNAAALEQFNVVRASCQACHDAYRS
ncbi:cytochrome c [Brevundimonas sp. NIBR11]|uniref:c-type cytochrome n=1 Tax=Brevundimonas sp. NIBR11 TaxID=3015999 RepID=UPI0022F0D127|nr:cytochrome c [Brevundimonas sp. NIBR11]WGM32419.1 Cytochrome c' [Brevundimonas sp. NIBR11]